MSEQLGRSKSSCIAYARKLGIKRDYRWTKEQIDYLKEYYPKLGAVGVASYLKRTPDTCQVKAASLGIQYKDPLKWTPEEESLLAEYYPREGVIAVAKLIGKSESACRSHADAMGLSYDTAWSQEEIRILQENYPKLGPLKTSELLNRSRSACAARARLLNIHYESTAAWTKEEIEILRQYYPLEGAKVAERLPGRSISACMNCAAKHGIRYGKSDSMGIQAIKNFLHANHIKYRQEVTFENCKYEKHLRFDFAIFLSENDFPATPSGLIEFDGGQHFKPIRIYDYHSQGPEYAFHALPLRDEIKNQFCRQFHIPLLRIRYDQYKYIDNIVKHFVENIYEYRRTFNPLLSENAYYESTVQEAITAFRSQYAVSISSLKSPGALSCHTWTENDRAFLKQYYASKDIHWIASQLFKSPSSCLSQARKMHLKRNPGHSWSANEDAFLKQHYSQKGALWTANQLGRTVNACQHRASRISARTNRSYFPWTPEEDAILVKYQHQKTHLEIGKMLHRSKYACDARAKKLNITKSL